MLRTQSPDCLEENCKNWTTEYVTKRAEKKAKKTDKANKLEKTKIPAHKFSWRDSNCYSNIRDALLNITQIRCAFCDGTVGATSRKTVEHFKPKGKYPELAYDWNNLFACCDMCQSQKLEKFDENILKPDEENYELKNHFLLNYKSGELEAVCDENGIPCIKAITTITMYGLNSKIRNTERLRTRKKFYNSSDPDKNLDEYDYRFFLKDN